LKNNKTYGCGVADILLNLYQLYLIPKNHPSLRTENDEIKFNDPVYSALYLVLRRYLIVLK